MSEPPAAAGADPGPAPDLLEDLARRLADGSLPPGDPSLATLWRSWSAGDTWDRSLVAALVEAVGGLNGATLSRLRFEARITELWAAWLDRLR